MLLNNKNLLRRSKENALVWDKAQVHAQPASHYPHKYQDKAGDFTIPDVYACRLEDVSLCGPAGVGLVNDNEIILDTAYAGRIDVMMRNSPYLDMASFARTKPATHLDHGVSLCGVWGDYYFHYILEMLPKLLGYSLLSEDGEDQTVIVSKNPPKYVLEGLEIMGFPNVVRMNDHLQVDDLVIPFTPRKNGWTHPDAARWVAEEMRSRVEHMTYEPRRYYISRALTNKRRLVNYNEIRYILGDYGFIDVSAEKFPLDEQVRMFANAEVIVGPHGGGLTNMVYAKDTKVIELMTPAYINPCFYLLATALDIPYHLIMCDPVGEEDMRVDPKEFEQAIQEALT